MSKFSVKKPFTVLVMVLVMLILGIVSVQKMQMDLLPEVSLPYIMVITTYPGASPEAVESTIAEPMESSLGVISGVENVYSFSYENYCMVQLEFADGTDLDAVLVKVYTALDTVRAAFPEEVGTPQVLELSTDMLASMYLAVSYEGMDIEELSRFTEETLAPAIERQEGVASVSVTGLIDKTIQVELQQDKIDALNEKILAVTEDKLNEALGDIEEGRQQLLDSQADLNKNRDKLNDSQADLDESRQELADSIKEMEDGIREINENQFTLDENKDKLDEAQSELNKQKESLASTKTQIFDLLNNYGTLKSSYDTQKDSLTTMLSNMGKTSDEIATALANPTTLATYLASVTGNDAIVSGWAQLSTAYTQATAGLNSFKSTLASEGYVFDYSDISTAKIVATAFFKDAEAQLAAAQTTINNSRSQIQAAQEQLSSARDQIEDGQKSLDSAQEQIDSGQETINDSWSSLQDGQKQINEGWESYYEGLDEFERQKAEALRQANANQLLTLSTLSQIIYAQNFSMPAGYVDDENDNSWLLKVGNNFDSLEDLENMVLVHIDDVGDVRLKDVAVLTVVDNSDSTYARLNNREAIILSVFKGSTTGTNEVSGIVKEEIARLEESYEELSMLVIMDQGDYINLIVDNVVSNMIVGAALAILILAIFLKDFMPTIVVAISIPLSVLTALVAMYFSGISLNMMSLSGMALGIGMLVDNSIVVIENIYRLRSKGVSAARAAVQGSRQVAGAVIASTLTSVCVFFPMVYTTGLVRELMLPMALTIIFCLLASLLIAMTVVPAAGSTLLRRTKPKEHRLFDKIMELYGKSLGFCLKVKILPLALAIGLLAFSVWQVLQMGIVLIPDMTSNQIQATLTFPEDMERAECYETSDEIIDRILKIEGIGSIAVMAGGDDTLLVSGGSGNTEFRNYSYMLNTADPNAGAEEVHRIVDEIEGAMEGLPGELTVSTGMSEMTEFLGSGLSISIYGDDQATLLQISEDIMDIVAQVPGYTEISNGQEDADEVMHLQIDRNKAMSEGLSVAQIFQDLNSKLTTSADSVKVTIDGVEMQIKVMNDGVAPINKDNLMDYNFEVSVKDEDGNTITEDRKLSDYATVEYEPGVASIQRENQSHYITVTAGVEDGANTTLLTRELEPLIEAYEAPDGYTVELGGEYETTQQMVSQMGLVMLLGLAFVYFVMVAQFQSLLSPFIILFTVPLAFTGGLLALWFTGEPLSIISLMGFLMLLGTVVNNGIVFVDYTNQLRVGGLDRHMALIATGKTRMRPILMTALTTILAEASLLFGDDMGSQMGRGMALVIAGGLAYATLMTLYIIPVIYDILFKKKPLAVDVGSDDLDDVPDDAAEFLAAAKAEAEAKPADETEE